MVRVRERMCLVSRQTKPESALIRIAFGPDDVAAPDLAAKLPGRGAWITADRGSVERAVKKGLLARAAGRPVKVDSDLAGRIEGLLAQRCLAQLGLAKRSGTLAVGFTAVRAALKNAPPAYLVEALDGAADGRGKVLALARAAWGEPALAGCFSAEDIGAALGRGPVMHAALSEGAAAVRFAQEIARLAGFRRLWPEAWEAADG